MTRKRRPLFTDITTARLLVRELRRLHDDGDVVSLAWVVMPDHITPALDDSTERSLAPLQSGKDRQIPLGTRH